MKALSLLLASATLALALASSGAVARAPHVRQYQQRMIPAPYPQGNRGASGHVDPPGTIPPGSPPVYQSISPSGTPGIRQPNY
jgi:hypothetical protein